MTFALYLLVILVATILLLDLIRFWEEPEAAMTFFQFCVNYPPDGSDLADLCGEIRCDPEAPRKDKALFAHLVKLFGDGEIIDRLWAAYRRELRKTGVRGSRR